jgi:hypothetical protein
MNKTRLNYSFIRMKIVAGMMVIVILILICERSSAQESIVEQIAVAGILVAVLLFDTFRPKVFFNSQSLFIKRMLQREKVIPLGSISIVKPATFSYYRGFQSYIIEYSDQNGLPAKVKFRTTPECEKLYRFFQVIKAYRN